MKLFILTLKKYLSDNRRSLLLKLAGVIGAWIILGAFMAAGEAGGGDGEVAMLLLVSMVATAVFASQSFADMGRPSGRISALMLPSTAATKFMVRWVVAVPVALIALTCCCLLTEVTRVTLWPLFNHPHSTTFLSLPIKHEAISIARVMGSLLLVIQAFFFFGAIVWPRLSFIKTLLAGWILQTLFSTVLLISMPSTNGNFSYSWTSGADEYFDVIFMTISLITAVLFYILAFIRFRESDLADRLI